MVPFDQIGYVVFHFPSSCGGVVDEGEDEDVVFTESKAAVCVVVELSDELSK